MSRLDDALATIDAALEEGVTDVVTDPAASYARRNLAVPLDALFPDQGIWDWTYQFDEVGEHWEGQRWRSVTSVDAGPDPWWHLDVRAWLNDPYYQQDVLQDADDAHREAQEERREGLARLMFGV